MEGVIKLQIDASYWTQRAKRPLVVSIIYSDAMLLAVYSTAGTVTDRYPAITAQINRFVSSMPSGMHVHQED